MANFVFVGRIKRNSLRKTHTGCFVYYGIFWWWRGAMMLWWCLRIFFILFRLPHVYSFSLFHPNFGLFFFVLNGWLHAPFSGSFNCFWRNAFFFLSRCFWCVLFWLPILSVICFYFSRWDLRVWILDRLRRHKLMIYDRGRKLVGEPRHASEYDQGRLCGPATRHQRDVRKSE